MPLGTIYKTGGVSPQSAYYKWIKYTDGTSLPFPTSTEREIFLDKDSIFPPIKSCNKGAYWAMTSLQK